MQSSFNFNSEHFLTTTFFNFVEKKYFNFFLSFGASQNSFIILKFPAGVMKEIVAKLRSGKFCYFEKNLENPEYKAEEIVFCNLESYLGKGTNGELRFLDFSKSILPQGVSFIGIISENFIPNFSLLDVKSRYDAAIPLVFASDTPFDFHEIALNFLHKNGIKLEPEILNSMMLQINRDISSFTIFIEELKKFIETHKVKVNRHHFKTILENYEKARNKANF